MRVVGVDLGVGFSLFKSELRHVNPDGGTTALGEIAQTALSTGMPEISASATSRATHGLVAASAWCLARISAS